MSKSKKALKKIDDEILREKICKKCEFYKEGEKLECYAYKLNKRLLEEGKINIDEI